MTGQSHPIAVPPSFARMPRWWHDEPGREWLSRLPAQVAAQCRRWHLEPDGAPAHGSNALVVPVRRGAEPLALRLAPPGDDVAAHARALRLWDGRGTVLLHDADPGRGALLLERLDGSVSLDDLPMVEAVRTMAELVVVLAVPVPDDVPSTAATAAELLAAAEPDWEALDRPIPRVLLDRALAHTRERADAPAGGTAVNGDLHGAQVLRGTRRAWLAVDPVLLRGDPEHDLGRVLWTRLDDIADDDLPRLVALFATTAGVPVDRARSWVVVRALSYLLWGLRHGLTEDPPRCRRLLEAFA